MLYKETLSLTELLGGEGKPRRGNADDLFTTTLNAQPRLHEFYWRQGEQGKFALPVAAIPAYGDAETLYADVATFYPQLSPISAYMHVLNSDISDFLLEPDFGKMAAYNYFSGIWISQHKVWIALSITEAISNAYSNNSGQDFEPTYSFCRRTLSYALARTNFLYPQIARREVAVNWLKLRDLAKMESSAGITASILWIGDAAFGGSLSAKNSKDSGFKLSSAIGRLVDGSLPYERFASLLCDIYPTVRQYFELLSGNYDGRMYGLNQIINAIRMTRGAQEIDALAIAFFCNSILPGTLTHVKFLARFISDYPSILLWYGFFSALSDNFDWRGVMSGIGQKLSRDICAPFDIEDSPVADISLQELEVLARIGLSSGNVKPIQQRAMLVAVFPGVEIFVRFSSKEESAILPNKLVAELEEKERRIASRDQALQRLLGEAQELLRGSDFNEASPGNHWSEKIVRRKKPGSKKANEDF